jgi:hypothetical protein
MGIEGDMAVLQAHVEEMRHDFYGNGKPGLLSELRDFFAVQKEREAAADKAGKMSDNRMKLIATVCACAPFAYDVAKHFFLWLTTVLK